ncbi:MAG: hypothetical protein COC01_04950 [Bacteroidetes bacterium]|nr:MAG: hypothetical protein COC01_04950 [Bacteroidota bacterium]
MRKLILPILLLVFNYSFGQDVNKALNKRNFTAGDELIQARTTFFISFGLALGSGLLLYNNIENNDKTISNVALGTAILSLGFTFKAYIHIGRAGKKLNKLHPVTD